MNPLAFDDPTGRRRRVARRAARAAGVVALVVAVGSSALAGEGRLARGPRGGGGMRAAQMNNRMMRAERFPNAGPRVPQFREVAPPQPQAVERPPMPAPVDRGGRPGRLTPEERRALRQQINDAGRDIYRVP